MAAGALNSANMFKRRMSLPGYRTISIAAKVGGSFHLVDEGSGGIRDVEAGAPAP